MIRALEGGDIDRPPVWLMRQAGRYMPEYRELKAKYSFLELCKSSELSHRITMQPLDAFRVDAAIIFADILLPLEGMGIQIDFSPGPSIANPVKNAEDVKLLCADPGAAAQYVPNAIKSVREDLKNRHLSGQEQRAVLGFAGAPWTLASYLIDQGPYKQFLGTLAFAKSQPKAMQELLDKLCIVVCDYLLAQIEAGAQAVQLFDTWAGMLSGPDFEKFVLPYLDRIICAIKPSHTPLILYINGCSHLIPLLKKTGVHALSLDWRLDLKRADAELGARVSIQGNLDPTNLLMPEDEVRKCARDMIKGISRRSRYIANLGHGVLPHTPVSNVNAFVEAVREGW